jgi:plasmid maintenance system antidote protein VapI
MREKITIEEFMKKNKMKKKDFASFLGLNPAQLSRCLNQGKSFTKKTIRILEANNIEYESYKLKEEKKEEKEVDFENYFERGLITNFCHSKEDSGEYYCYTERQVNFITSYFNKKKIAYYSFFKEYYWVVKFDRNEDFEVMQ